MGLHFLVRIVNADLRLCEILRPYLVFDSAGLRIELGKPAEIA